MTPEELKKIHNLLGHLARQLWDLQQWRISASNRVAAMEREDEIDPDDIERVAPIVTGLEEIERKIEAEIRRTIRLHPLAPWITAQRGIGLATFANLLGVARDLSRFETVSKLWKYLGLHTVDGIAPKKKKGEPWTHTDCQHLHLTTCPLTCTTEHHPNCAPGVPGTAYSPKGRTICYMLGEAIVKVGGNGPYRAAYDRKKRYYEEERPDWPQIRRHKAAMRYASKLFIRELWITWHRHFATGRIEEWEERERERAAGTGMIPIDRVPPRSRISI